ncbi:hypothetical protein PINS_up003662 [Pythium insidiosum]|nr:hypothetical protein PINS_up003662 [Pythium insidiosum]
MSDGESDGGSSSTSEGSSESSSSSDSEDMDGAMNAATTLIRLDVRSKQDREPQETSHPPTPDSLKVKLKLPPGFIAKQKERPGSASTTDRGKFKVQVSNSQPTAKKKVDGMNTQAVARKKAPGTAKSKKTAGSKRKKTDTPASSGQSSNDAKQRFQQQQQHLPSQATVGGPTAHILLHLIPKGDTIPSDEVRGKMELSFVNKQLSETRPSEVTEVDLSSEFDDPFATEADALRNLDLFSFCDEYGNPIGLEILERPKEERPRIMGFGTVTQHLPVSDRPLPVKCVLPSPAFPSRSRKRQRSDQTSPSPAQKDVHKVKRPINSPEHQLKGQTKLKPVKADRKMHSKPNSDEQGAAYSASDSDDHESAVRTEESDSGCDTEGASVSDHLQDVKSARKSIEDQQPGQKRRYDGMFHSSSDAPPVSSEG